MPVNDAVMERRVERAVADYISHHRNDAANERRFYRGAPTLSQAITRAANACTAGGRKHPHQWRIPRHFLQEFGARLSDSKRVIRKATSFDELHEIVREVGEQTYMIGELTIYDTAHRIGCKLGLSPARVYLHSGTRSGALAIGIHPSRTSVPVKELPKPFAVLKPYEIEDCLCIFKGLLSGEGPDLGTRCGCDGRGCVRWTS
ncbi:MAG: hypothetical protein F4Y63_09980 [Chloroflexi bacterium]|nr:hypothetical protein [Chloroflexota bacterium]MYF80135.1 hypothetical protein [Chloroflexota bacterium]MYK62147.1 hypothetical protein [Chloroflexota bacterium]